MKMFVFAAALMLGSAAVAQTGNTVDDPSQSSGPRGVTQQGTDPDGQACTPAGYNAGTTGYPTCEAGSASAASTATPPRCSKTVKDHCVQAYERGVRR
jgi:hypothetical protein